jgi:argininosuccinate lyase
MLQVLLGLAKAHTETVMPGYTHLQVAQPITFAHHMMAYAEMFVRDRDRLGDAVRRLDVSPLGSGALAANPYPINRERVAELLAMGGITRNSLDGVSDRDYVIELLSVFSLMMVHLSRFSEEIILWNSQGFGFIELDDAYSTGSSMMPQKKNPDVAELARGKAGRVFGHLQAMLTTLKALPLAYNKDMQEDKEALFDAVDTVLQCLPVFTDMLATMTVYPDKMVKAAQSGHINATDAADYLVEHGVTFREAHEIIGQMVRYCAERSMNIDDLSMNELQQFSPKFNVDIYTALDLKTCINRRCVPGGPAPGSVLAHVAELEASLSH